MIYLCFANIPDKLSPYDAAIAATSFFVGESNSAYFQNIKSRISGSAVESLYAYALLGRMIKEHFPLELQGVDPPVLKRGQNGKPYFANSQLKFSISHSKGFVVCALSDDCKVGIDIEASTIAPEKARKLAARYFDPSEQEIVEQSPEKFSRMWTKKEAISKFFGGNFADFIQKALSNELFDEISLHNFQYRSHPVTLCTTRDYGKIILLDGNEK